MKKFNPPKTVIYSYLRKSDNHLFQVEYTEDCIKNKSPFFIFMEKNNLYRLISKK